MQVPERREVSFDVYESSLPVLVLACNRRGCTAVFSACSQNHCRVWLCVAVPVEEIVRRTGRFTHVIQLGK